MSYSAYVMCRCWQDGKTDIPPHPVLLDEEGLNLDIPYPEKGTNEEMNRYHQMVSEFESWMKTACPHNDMELANEYLSNISGMEKFRHLIKGVRDNRLTTLAEYLPRSHGGFLPAGAARKALNELEIIENCSRGILKTILEEATKGHLIFSINGDASTIFCWGGRIRYCLDQRGFFVLEDKEHIIFSSRHFTQEPLSNDTVKLTDIPSGKSIEKVGGITIHPNPLSKNEFVITKKTVPICEEYSYMTIPLHKLLIASIETGNPIHWT